MRNKNHWNSRILETAQKVVTLSGELSLAVERRFRQSVPFSGAEQAEVGQWPYLLALCYRYRGFKYPPGILVGFASPLETINSILSGIPYTQIYSAINKQSLKDEID